ncbi:hypothetical protein ACP3V3_18605 [Vibrio sp. PNB22_3_1]
MKSNRLVLCLLILLMTGCATYKEHSYKLYDTNFSEKAVWLWVQTKSPFEHPITNEIEGYKIVDKFCKEWGFKNGVKIPVRTETANVWGGTDYVFKYQCSDEMRTVSYDKGVHKATGTEPYLN